MVPRRHEISDVQNLDCSDCYQQNPNKCIIQEDVYTYIQYYNYGVYAVEAVYVYIYNYVVIFIIIHTRL